jgi:hypothetical protein
MKQRCAYHKPFTVNFPDKCVWQNGLNPNNKGGLVWYTDRSRTNKSTDAGMYRWGSRKENSLSLGLHATVFQAEIYAMKACIMEGTEKCDMDRNIYIPSNSQTAIKAPDS